jgi:hypothetical protein
MVKNDKNIKKLLFHFFKNIKKGQKWQETEISKQKNEKKTKNIKMYKSV